VENRSQAAESNADQSRQHSSKEGIPREGPTEEEGCRVEEEKHQGIQWIPQFRSSQSPEPGKNDCHTFVKKRFFQESAGEAITSDSRNSKRRLGVNS